MKVSEFAEKLNLLDEEHFSKILPLLSEEAITALSSAIQGDKRAMDIYNSELQPDDYTEGAISFYEKWNGRIPELNTLDIELKYERMLSILDKMDMEEVNELVKKHDGILSHAY